MYRLIVYIIMKCKNKWIWNMFKWTFYFYFHLLPLDKGDLCKTGTLNVHSWAIKVIVNRRFWINYIMMLKNFKVYFKWGRHLISVVFHFDDFNYGRRSQPYFFLTIATQLVFFITYNKMKKIYITLSEQFQHSIEKS